MPAKNIKIKYRKINYKASEARETSHIVVHPDLLHGLRQIAKGERKTVSWLVETALSDYFGVEVMLRKCKTPPKPEFPTVVRNRRKRFA